jgi:hypothetical protein
VTHLAADAPPEEARSRWRRARFAFGWFDGWSYVPFAVVAGTLLYVIRRPQILTRAEFRVEDGQTFFLGTFFGSPIEGILRPYQGSVHVVPRLVALLERAVPIASAPLVANVAAVAIAVGVAAYVASSRLASAIPDRRLRLALGALVLFVPGVAEVHGSMTFVQWYLAVFLVAAAVASEPGTRRGRVAELSALALAGLTGPAVLLIAPVHVVAAGIRQQRWRTETAVVTCIVAVAQLIVLAVSTREAPGGGSLQDAAIVVVVRGLVEPILGARITGAIVDSQALLIVVTIGVVGCLIVLASGLPRLWLILLGYLWLAAIAATLVGSINRYATMLDPAVAQRYFFFPGLVIGAVILTALAHRRGLVQAFVATVLVIGIVADFRLARLPTHDWAVRSACIGGAEPCRVPVQPASGWTIRWPGPDGPYNQNRVYEP